MDLSRYNNTAFDRGTPRWKEALWVLVRGVFFLGWFPWPSGLRVFLLRAFGAKIGDGMVIRSRVNISFPWRFEAGDHVWIGEEVLVLSLATVTIGSSVCLSQRAFLCTGSHDARADTFDLVTKPVRIGGKSWIAAGAFVGPGVEVPAGTIVAAGAVLVKSPPPGSLLVAGNPAKVLQCQEGLS